MKRLVSLMLVAVCLAGAGCGDEETPTSPAPGPVAFSEYFAGVIAPSATKFYSFGNVQGGLTEITLASLTAATGGAIVSATPQLGLGVPSGTGCALTTSLNTVASLNKQISTSLAPGTYCVSLVGNGGISADTNFAIRITQGTLNHNSSASPTIFSSHLAVKGASTQTFGVAGGTGGVVTAKLDNFFPPGVSVGMGIGLWRPDLAVCSLNQVVNATAGAQISVSVDQGFYCVRIFDTGTLTDTAAFTISIIHP